MIRVGASGWSHEDWVGPVYPVPLRARPERWLEQYAQKLRAVELTSTFHASADDDLVKAWCRDGVELLEAGPFEFSLQAPREVTHDALAEGDFERAWAAAARFERGVLDPIADEGLLGAVLVRLPPTFAPSADAAARLREVLAAFAGRSIALHFDDAAWNASPHARDLLRNPDVCLVEDDARPALPGARHAYLRPTHVDVGALAQRARAHVAQGREVRVILTNPQGGRAVADGVALLHALGEATHVPVPRLTAQTRLE